jgi:hypothetical protein
MDGLWINVGCISGDEEQHGVGRFKMAYVIVAWYQDPRLRRGRLVAGFFFFFFFFFVVGLMNSI